MESRSLYDHKVNGLSEAISIEVTDKPGSGGANHCYEVYLGAKHLFTINFQNGPIQEVGFNGVSNEALLAILIDRMRGFQSGQFACRDNACALTHMEEALMWLQKRTNDRIRRGVEGTHEK